MSEVKYNEIMDYLKNLYFANQIPWVVAYSGGKDSTMVVSLVINTLLLLPVEQRLKKVVIVSSNTGVEIPTILNQINDELSLIQVFSDNHRLNITTHLLTPPISQSFWINLIGRGYTAPTRNFRWCTQRLKINPVSTFIKSNFKSAIILLGVRSSESRNRKRILDTRIKDDNGLRKHSIKNCLTCSPIEELTTEDVWEYLLLNDSPYGGDNNGLYHLYKDASSGDCNLTLDKKDNACGNSRFGCWTCTVVKKDKASEGLIESGRVELKPLLEFREYLIEVSNFKNGYRECVRKDGVTPCQGAFTLEARKLILEKLISTQYDAGISLISNQEINLIKSYWSTEREKVVTKQPILTKQLTRKTKSKAKPSTQTDQLTLF